MYAESIGHTSFEAYVPSYHLAGSPTSRSRYYGHSFTPRTSYHPPRTTFSRSLGPSLGRNHYYMGSAHVSTAAHAIRSPSSPLVSSGYRRTFAGVRSNTQSANIVHHGDVHY
mmetsp:Transcript_109274/g.348695  ORF Transcript_109274/g.348695 Transcript_109274/m.348695 type:complete len:112 (+) Transcript_109274:99-434(+)